MATRWVPQAPRVPPPSAWSERMPTPWCADSRGASTAARSRVCEWRRAVAGEKLVQMRFAHVLAVAAALALLATGATSASAQTLGDVLGTTILNDTLTGTVLPNLTQTVPDPESDPQTQQQQPAATKPAATPAPSGRALGYYCRSESKKHAAGKKTPFAQCVAAMRSLRTGKTKSPFPACRTLTHKRAPGTKHSPFSLCISGAKQLLADRTTGSAAQAR